MDDSPFSSPLSSPPKTPTSQLLLALPLSTESSLAHALSRPPSPAAVPELPPAQPLPIQPVLAQPLPSQPVLTQPPPAQPSPTQPSPSPARTPSTSHSTAPVSPKRQCACPCGPFKAELKSAVTLMTFVLRPTPALVISPYPCDPAGNAIPIGDLRKYSKTHLWPEGIKCFCSLRPGGVERSVRLFVPSHGSSKMAPCLGCPDWTPDGIDGCRYFVNLRETFEGADKMFGIIIPMASFPLRGGRAHMRRLLISSSAQSCMPDVARPTTSSSSSVKSNTKHVQDYFPHTFRIEGVKPGLVYDPDRISSPPPLGDVSRRVEEMPLPCDAEVREVFTEMTKGAGVPYRRLMAVIGGCTRCDYVMALPNILQHKCIATTNSAQAIVAGSSVGGKQESDSEIEFVDGPIASAPKRKRKINVQPPQRVLIRCAQKPRARGPPAGTMSSSMPPVKEASVEINLAQSPVRIATPEDSCDVYRDVEGEFVMYKKI